MLGRCSASGGARAGCLRRLQTLDPRRRRKELFLRRLTSLWLWSFLRPRGRGVGSSARGAGSFLVQGLRLAESSLGTPSGGGGATVDNVIITPARCQASLLTTLRGE